MIIECGNSREYPTTTKITFEQDTRGLAPDQWFIRGDELKHKKYTYHRRANSNTGSIKIGDSKTDRVAKIFRKFEHHHQFIYIYIIDMTYKMDPKIQNLVHLTYKRKVYLFIYLGEDALPGWQGEKIESQLVWIIRSNGELKPVCCQPQPFQLS